MPTIRDNVIYDNAAVVNATVGIQIVPTPEHPTFDSFIEQVRALLEPTASGKGYSTTGVDGQNQLYEFVQSFAGNHHALGEIVYKAKRYAAKGNPDDILKIAAWAYLAWKHDQRS